MLQWLEEECRNENMDRLNKDIKKIKGGTAALSTGLKDGGEKSKAMMDEDEEEEVHEGVIQDFETFSEDKGVVDEDGDK